jgi:hypothetical protein
MGEHTPWTISEYGQVNDAFHMSVRIKGFAVAGGNAGQEEAEATTAFIVKAVNMHQELVNALKDCAFTLGAIDPAGWSNTILCERVRDLIAKASGQYAALDELRKPVDEVRE